MNAVMNIQVRVINGNARSVLRTLRSDIDSVNRSLDGTNRSAARSSRSLTSWGNQIQWTGRQIQTNFTVPLLAAGAAAVHWQLQNEQAMTRIAKVYGDASLSAETMKNELEALGNAFQALSNHYGVQQSAVLDIAGDWAAAGSSGLALAKSVETTLQAMVLGELEAAEATQALIAIQAQYGLSSAKLAETIGILNAVENQTGISMAGLIKGFQRSAGVARTAGVDIRHLAAMLAAISPAAGSAAEAGNALKTIFSRLASPTRETTQVLGLMGISMDDMRWKSATATEQLQIMSKKFEELSDKQKEVVSTVVASRWQINKFSILMRELASENGYYQKALDATASRQHVFNLYQKELNTVLSSNPRRLQIVWTMLQNAATDIIQPLIPIILYLANGVRLLVQAFANLDPALQKLIIFGALALAFLGPLIRYVGSLATVIGSLAIVLGWVLAPFVAFVGLIGTAAVAAWGALVSGIGAVGAGLTFLATGMGVFIGKFFAVFTRSIIGLVRILPTMMAALSTAITVGGALLSAAWAAIWYGITALLGPAFAAMLRGWRVFMLAISILTTGLGAGLAAVWAGVWMRMQLVMTAAARILGMTWRLVTLSMAATTWTWGTAFARLWMTIQMLLTQILIASAKTLGVVWRGALAFMTAISMAFGTAFGPLWARIMASVRAVIAAASAAIAAFWRIFMLTLSVITAEMGAALRRAWASLWAALRVLMIASAAVMGVIYRAFTVSMAVTTAALGPALARLWQAIVWMWQGILIAGSAIAGGIYRAAVAGMAAFTMAIRPLFAAGWAGLVAIARAGALAMAFTTTIVSRGLFMLVMLPARFAGILRGGWMLLLMVTRAGIMGIASLIGTAVGAIGAPAIIAIAAVVALVIAFWDEIKAIWNNIVAYFQNSGNTLATAVRNIFGGLGDLMQRVFNKLPEGVKNAMLAVVRIVAAAARQVYEWFSYINPFAHHSPSLVENVTDGMAAVRAQFATLSQVEGYVKSAYATINQFGSATAGLAQRNQAAEFAEQRKSIVSQSPGAGPAFDAMVAQVNRLTPVMNALKSAVASQQIVVDRWSKALEAANDHLNHQQKLLDDARSTLDTWMDTPIEGQRAMSDAIFENSMAQKRLQLQMMDMEKVTGPLDDINSRMSAIRGEMDQLQGTRTALQQGGAGSDILSFYDEQLASLEGEGSGLTEQAKALQEMQKELDRLGQQGQRLDLENSLKFDPLIRQIEQASSSMREMPFDEILAGVKSSKAEVDRLTVAYDQAVAARDAIQASYDAENAKLTQLKDAYDSIHQAIQDITGALGDMASAADNAIQRATGKKGSKGALSPGAENFLAAEGGNFPDPGSDVAIGREGGLGDQSGMIDQFTKDLAKETSGMFAGLNPLEPLKRWWNKAWEWLKTNVGPLFTGLGDFIGAAFSGINIPNPFSAGMVSGWLESLKGWIDPLIVMLTSIGTTILNVFTTLWGWISAGWEFISPILSTLWDGLVTGLMAAWEQIAPELAKFKDLLAPIGEAISNLWTIIKPVIGLIAGALFGAFTLIMSIVANTIGPLLEMIGGIIAGVIRVIRGIIEFIVGVFTLDWEMAWNGIKDIFGGVIDIIGSIIEGVVEFIIGVFTGVIDWVTSVFAVVWDEYLVPAWEAAWGWIKDTAVAIWTEITQPFVDAYNWVNEKLTYAWDLVQQVWGLAWDTISTWATEKWEMISQPFIDAYDWINEKLQFAWAIIQEVWGLAWDTISTWAEEKWEAISQPFIDAYNWIEDKLQFAWDIIQQVWSLAWDTIKTWAKEKWEQISKPFKDAYDWVNSKLKGLWEDTKKRWSDAWATLKQWAGEKWDQIMKPLEDAYNWLKDKFSGIFGTIKQKFKDAWDGLVKWFKDAADWIVDPLKGAINMAIGAVNTLIKGLNKVADLLPGLDWHIDLIPKFASGGGLPTRRVGSGFKTRGARAIVGEGNPNHPEYVIPTDPQYKGRASKLFLSLAKELGFTQNIVSGSEGAFGDAKMMFADGGILGSIKDALGDAGSFFTNLGSDILAHVADGAATYIIKPALGLMDPLIDKIPWKFARGAAKGMKNKVVDWLKVADDAVRSKVDEGGAAGVPAGRIREWILQALSIIKEPTSLSKGIYNIIMHESGGNPRAINLWDINAQNGTPSKGLMQTIDPTFNAYSIPGHRDIWNPIDNIIAGTRYAISRYGRDWLRAGGNRDKNGNYIGYEIGGVLGNIPSLAEGAYIRRKVGGTLVRVGEGKYDEAVMPLPHGISQLGSGDGGSKIYNFYGDLSFPNITSGEDAKAFIDNLETLTAR